jgi:hypothetical protein
VTKHLRVLEWAGLVCCAQTGQERHFAFDPAPLGEMQEILELRIVEVGCEEG